MVGAATEFYFLQGKPRDHERACTDHRFTFLHVNEILFYK